MFDRSTLALLLAPLSVQVFEPDPVYDGPLPESPRDARRLHDWDDEPSGWVYAFSAPCLGPVYVGMSLRPSDRFESHRRRQPWFPVVDWYTLLRFNAKDRAEARAIARHVEGVSIRRLRPLGNVAGVPR